MRAQQIIWNGRLGWSKPEADTAPLVLYFGTREALASGVRYDELRGMFPKAHILGCSTGGQISNNDVNDDEVVAAAIDFDATQLRLLLPELPHVRLAFNHDKLNSRHARKILQHLRRHRLAESGMVRPPGINPRRRRDGQTRFRNPHRARDRQFRQ